MSAIYTRMTLPIENPEDNDAKQWKDNLREGTKLLLQTVEDWQKTGCWRAKNPWSFRNIIIIMMMMMMIRLIMVEKDRKRTDKQTLASCPRAEKERNVNLTVILMIFEALGIDSRDLEKKMAKMEIRERIETVRITALMRSVRILRRVLDT